MILKCRPLVLCYLYYKSFIIVIYDRNDSAIVFYDHNNSSQGLYS